MPTGVPCIEHDNWSVGPRQKTCRDCHNAVTRASRAKRFVDCISYLGGKCVDCGYNDNVDALQFDHALGKKSFPISSNLNMVWEKLVAELDKCELRCANCHTIRTIQEQRAAHRGGAPRKVA